MSRPVKDPLRPLSEEERAVLEQISRSRADVRRTPDREKDGTAQWSLVTLQRALRRAPDGLARVSTQTIWTVLQAAGYRFGRDQTWCHTGVVQRRGKSGGVEVVDPDAGVKKS